MPEEQGQETKPIWQSKTVAGIVIAWMGYKLRVAGLDIPDEMLHQLTDWMIEGGIMLAGFGRIVASQKLK